MNNSGFSLMQTVLALGITSIITLSVLSSIQMQNQSLIYTEKKLEWIDLKRNVNLLLMNDAQCSYNFTGKPVTGQKVVTDKLRQFDPTGIPLLGSLVEVGKKLESKLNIGSIEIVDLEQVVGKPVNFRSGKLVIDFENDYKSTPLKPIVIDNFTLALAAGNSVGVCAIQSPEAIMTNMNAGKTCPPNYMMIGFDQAGSIMCQQVPDPTIITQTVQSNPCSGGLLSIFLCPFLSF